MKQEKRRKPVAGIVLLLFAISAGVYFAVRGSQDGNAKRTYPLNPTPERIVKKYPNAKFAVISDLHYYDPELGISGAAFEEDLATDRKLLRDSVELLQLTMDELLASDIQFVLIPGDLTKDGEKVNHEKLSEQLEQLRDRGIQAFVIPGNHDVNNPLAYRYEGDQKILVPNVQEADFAEIYQDFGYGAAIDRDPASLSYVAEPAEGLWLVALDSTRSRENVEGKPEVYSGSLSQAQVNWLKSTLEKAVEQEKAVMVMMHHGVVEHWQGQHKLHPGYLVEDYAKIGEMLASYGVRLVFTGHYHAQDIAEINYPAFGTLYDVETGSVVTPPCPMRFLTLADNTLQITSRQLVGQLKPGTDFVQEAEAFTQKTLYQEAYNTLRKYLVSEKDSEKIANAVADAFAAHYRGDESLDPASLLSPDELGLWGKFIYSQQRYVIDGLAVDTGPADNEVALQLVK